MRQIEEIRERLLAIASSDDQVVRSIPGTQHCVIYKNGLIWHSNRRKPILPYYNQRYLYVDLVIDGMMRSVRLCKLLLLTYNPLHVSLAIQLRKVDVVIVDGDESNISLDNVVWKIPYGGIETEIHPGWYAIPGNPELLVSKTLEFAHWKDLKKVNVFQPQNTRYYPVAYYTHDLETKSTFSTKYIHRLIALAFLPIEDVTMLFVNHIDGDKKNYVLKNLEWVTSKENADHAIESGLRDDSEPVKALNLVTGEITHYASVNTCARNIGIPPQGVSLSMTYYAKYGAIRNKPWLILPRSVPFPEETHGFLDRLYPGCALRIAITVDDSTEVLFGLGEFRRRLKELGVFDEQLALKLNYEPLLFGSVEARLLRYGEFPEKTKVWDSSHVRGGKTQLPIRVTKLDTQEETFYPDTESFATLVGARRKTIQRRMLYNGGIWNGYRIEFLRQ